MHPGTPLVVSCLADLRLRSKRAFPVRVLRASRAPFHQQRIHRSRLVRAMVIYRPDSVLRERLAPCSTRSEIRPTDLCKPIFSKKSTRDRSVFGAPGLSPRSHRRRTWFTPRTPQKPSRAAETRGTLSFPRAAPERDLRRFVITRRRLELAFARPRTSCDLDRLFAGPVKETSASATRSAFRRCTPLLEAFCDLPASPPRFASRRLVARSSVATRPGQAPRPPAPRDRIVRKRVSTQTSLRADDVHRRLPHDTAREHAREPSIPDALTRDGRRTPKCAPAELTALGSRPEGRLAPQRRLLGYPWSPRVLHESRDSPHVPHFAALGPASTVAPRRATTFTGPDTFHRLEPPRNVAFALVR